jgi:hypothetical protein
MIFLLLSFFGCANQIELVYTTETCVDWDFSSEEPELRIESDGDDVVIRRVGIQGYCGDQFQPDIQVVEYWNVDATTDCEACLAARLTMLSPPSGEYKIEWFQNPEVITPAHDEQFVVE